MQNLLDDLKSVLSQEPRYIIGGQLAKTNIVEDALKVEPLLVRLLLKNETIKKHFFVEIEQTLIFDKVKFQEFVSNEEFLPSSYTKFKNQIGLSAGGQLFSKNKEVVLAYPYKDCVLEGGQTKEEQGRDEIFYNETLSPDEINILFEPKVLTKFEQYSVSSHSESGSLSVQFNRNEKGIIADNLLIKGNNLLALHTIKKEFEGQVKLIYIDPPYNTGNDGFKYNDRFNHSTWLTFMKNRLEIAKQFLRDDGVIFVQCDDNEQAYLKVLLDEIFGIDNFISNSIVVINRGGRDYGGIAKTHEYLLIYSKKGINELNMVNDSAKQFKYKDEKGGFDLMELRNRNILFNDKNRPNLCYPFYVNPNNQDSNELYEISLEKKKGFIEALPLKSQGIQTVWRWGKEKVLENINLEVKAKLKNDGDYMIVQKYRKTETRQRSVWDDTVFVNERGTEHIKELFGKKAFMYPKSEFLLSRVIEISTSKNDIVLDFFSGSGATAAAAHKMGRQWLAIEQMDYIDNVTKERLKKVIDGEQGGISQSLNWKGGGSFIYCELMQWNEKVLEQIRETKTTKDLLKIYETIKNEDFMRYEIKDFNKTDFEKLSIKEQKTILCDCLDKNQLYVNLSEIDDTKYNVSNDDKKLNKDFFRRG
ncbi:MAG: site-specific DNA-methyltransferase [Elusimicrobiota bacterium]|nr:site-specific DNA-methyltransferase [Elusimicrobiota bacterium]